MTHNRILVFSTDDHLYPTGGAEQAFGNVTERLPYIEFDLICAKLRKDVSRYEKVKNVHIHRLGLGIPKIDGIILALFGHYYAYKLMRKHQYDLMWSIMASYGAFSALRVKKRTNIPFLLTLQEGDPFEYIYEKVKHVRKQFNEIFAFADGMHAISTYLYEWGKEMGFSGTEGYVIPNGVDLDAYTVTFSPEDIATKRRSFGFPEDAFILMTSSRLEVKNAIEDVVAALPHLPPHVCFVVCGSGSLERAIREQVEHLGLQSRVKFMGFVEPRELPLIMKSCDAFIRPSVTEGLGNAFLEAMAARIPVMGTMVGGITDFLRDGETGFAVEVHDPDSIVRGVERVMALTREEKETLLDRSERMIHERYDWDLVSKEMERLFNTLSA